VSDLRIDLAWLLMLAEQRTPGDPRVTDWGALVAAVARHRAEIFDVPVYDTPHARAAALLQLLVHVPALERSNALYASAVAYAYLVASGFSVTTSPERVRDLARLVKSGEATVHEIAAELRRWTGEPDTP
jgi:prophage maintenance system killer protein